MSSSEQSESYDSNTGSSGEEFQKQHDEGKTIPKRAGLVKKGSYVCIKGFPC